MPNSAYSLQLTAYRSKAGFTLISAGRTLQNSVRSSDIRRKEGFTLIEFLVVLGILAVTVSSTVLFLNAVLKGSNQSTITAEVKQNGQVVLDSLERQIRGAVDAKTCPDAPASCPAPPYDHITLIRADPDPPLNIQCFSASSSLNKNGRIGTAAVTNPAPAQFTDLTNTDTVNGVNVADCDFKVFAAGYSAEGQPIPTVVSIKFVVSQGLEAPSRQDYVASVPLQTTISLRRY